MSFTDFEKSISQGRPLRLYLFERGMDTYWAYTSADRNIDFAGRTYRATAINDDGIRQTGETSNDMLKVLVPGNNDIAKLYKVAQPSIEVWLTIRDIDWNDPTAALVVWSGSVASVSYPKNDRAEINCTGIETSLESNGLRRSYNRNCDHAIYSKGCALKKYNYAVSATITALDGSSITCQLSATPLHSLTYGFIEWKVGDLSTETRGIDVTSGAGGSVLTLIGGTAGLKVGQVITVYPGCDQSSQTCHHVFNNMINYGGIRHLPGKSPFDGDPIM